MQSDAATVTIIAAAIGGGIASLIAGGFTFLNFHLARRADERRQIRELAVKVALENWKIYKEVSDQYGYSMNPIDSFLIHAMYLVSALDGRLKTPNQIREHLRAGFAASNTARAEIDEHNKTLQEKRRTDKTH
jgi:hypothetical protein